MLWQRQRESVQTGQPEFMSNTLGALGASRPELAYVCFIYLPFVISFEHKRMFANTNGALRLGETEGNKKKPPFAKHFGTVSVSVADRVNFDHRAS